MEEQNTSTPQNQAVQPSSTQPTGYGVMDLYKSSWATVKKNLAPLAIVTLIGVAINVVVTALAVFFIVNNLFDGGFENIMMSILITAGVSLLAGVYVGLIQIIALKKATENQKVEPAVIMQESLKYLGRAIGYGLFVFAVFLATGFVLGVVSSAVGALGALLGLAAIVAIVFAAFKYAFVQFLIVEPKPMGFMERFKVSDKLTKGIYTTIFAAALLAMVLGIAGGIVSGILTSPFDTKAKSTNTSNTITFNFDDEDDLSAAFNESTKQAVKDEFGSKYLIKQLITSAISWGLGLVVMGAFLDLYVKRKKALGIQ